MPGTIQDPRMNQTLEKRLGVAYFDDEFRVQGKTYQAGHYFYKKTTGNPTDPFNSRYLPHGFPIIATGRVGIGSNDISNADLDRYRLMFPNLMYTFALTIEADPDFVDTEQDTTDTTNLDSLRAMAAYLHRCITQNIGPPQVPNVPGQGRGLGKFNLESPYTYRRDNTDVGYLEEL